MFFRSKDSINCNNLYVYISEILCYKLNYVCNEVYYINCKKLKIIKNILCGDYVVIIVGK